MKLSEISSVKQPSQQNSMTRIPLPISNDKSTPQLIDLLSTNNVNLQQPQTVQANRRLSQTRLRKPEIFAPTSIKASSSPSYVTTTSTSDTESSIPFPAFHRRISFPADANDILTEQLSKEREASHRLSANLISAQGLISQPNSHDGLQYLVDARSPTEKDCTVTHSQLSDPMSIDSDNNIESPVNAMSSKVAFNKYRHYLSPFEKTEILRYPVIYYVGSHAKKINASLDQTTLNHGYDDEKGDYKLITKDHLNYRYEVLETLGKGSFGQVVKCRDHKCTKSDPFNSTVAVKIIRNKKRFQAQALTEVKILEHLMKWDPKGKHYTVRMLDNFYFREHLCIVFECLSLNLYEVLQQNGYHGFSMGLVKRFAYQILMSVKLLNEHNIIHCDLKPENILLKQPDRSSIRVIDFGSSCYINEKIYTYIQSRFYRAPEIILGVEYGPSIDMWSTGCILAELYTGHPLFPGEDESDQLACIMQLLGIPDREYLERCTRRKQFFDLYDKPRRIINAKGKKRRPKSLTFAEALRKSPTEPVEKEFIDFIRRCLTWEPSTRMKPVEALCHPWLQSMKK
ncbi:kinase-like domain-containing protein [Mycotypha africana]|uniref:kinase-like domain-containing protein n=1 Tax=Mycotypha africana TaxID=64632 RepID=UPI002301279C|nr:kinase-like domain-containing protein [Mycotypha africana]KAI8972017.1 kinase-like domain-containing protein [Mycotypha africana]